jgi:hypothetical protein
VAVRELFSDDEWQRVKELPSDAAMLVITTGGGLFQMTKELAATAKAIVAGKDSTDELVAAVAADLMDHDATDKPVKPEGIKTPEQAHSYFLDRIRAAFDVVSDKAPQHRTAYGDFVVQLSHRVAEAAKEGFGGPRVSDAEKAALADIVSVASGSSTNDETATGGE